MSMYDPNKLLADSQANAILTKGADTIVLTVTECLEVAAGELGRWVMAKYTSTEHGDTLHVFKRTNMLDANARFQNSLIFHRDIGFVFANEQWVDSFFGSNLIPLEEIKHPFYD